MILNSFSIGITLNHEEFIFVTMKARFDRVWEEFVEKDSIWKDSRDERMRLSSFLEQSCVSGSKYSL